MIFRSSYFILICQVLCIVGKLIVDKPLNMGAFHTIMLKIWRFSRQVSFSEVGANMYVLELIWNYSNLLKVKGGCPWMFERHLILFKDFDGYTPIQDMMFDKETFWVQLHHLPLGGMNKSIGEKVGCAIGTVDMVDADINSVGLKIQLN